jgi:hypothetical protein
MPVTYVIGTVYANLLHLTSNRRLKRNIRVACRDPDPTSRWNSDQDRSAFNVAVINAERRIRPDANRRILYLHQDNARLGLARTIGHRWGDETQD